MEGAVAEEFVRRLRGLIEPDPQLQRAGLAYLDSLKASDNGWQLCVDALLSSALNAEEHVQFYCLQAVEHFVKTRYPAEVERAAPTVRRFLSGWVQRQCQMDGAGAKTYLRNKAAQVFALVFVSDFPDRWPTFLLDLLALTVQGPPAVDLYLRTLLQIDQEIVDREVVHSEQEARRNTRIRDAMREKCVLQLVESWHDILNTYASSQPQLACMCLDVVGKYVSWIDIGLVANARFVSVLVTLLGLVDVREAAADCIHDITHKGMEPVPKVQLVESLFAVLEQAAVFQLLEQVSDQSPAEDVDYLCKLGRVLNGMGTELVLCYHKLAKATTAEERTAAAGLEAAIRAKIPHVLAFLKCDYDDPSRSVVDFARDYVQLLKTKPMLIEVETGHVRDMVYVIIHKLKYDDDYDFEAVGEDEAMFQEYRKRLKVLYDNLAAVDRELVLHITQQFICSTLDCWKALPMKDVEAAVTMLYMLGEALPPASAGNFFSDDPAKVSVLQTMLRRLVTSDVVSYPHHIVPFQYFETISRYEKFFTVESALLPQVLTAFLDERGMNHPNERNKARAVYLFSRFIKCLKAQIEPFTDTILEHIRRLLALTPSENAPLNREDQLYLYETVAVLIISSSANSERKCEQLRSLLEPVVGQVGALAARLAAAPDDSPEAEQLQRQARHAVAVTARTTKAFSAGQTMKLVGCVPLYLQALQIFLNMLQGPRQYQLVQSGVIQFLHRLVVCLGEEVLPFIQTASEALLRSADVRKVQEYLPLLNQVVAKYKKDVVPFVTRAFMPIVETIFAALRQPLDADDEVARRDRQTLQRSYYLFLASLATNNVLEVLARQQPEHLQAVLLSVVQGAVELPDPVAQRSCFTILRRVTEAWGRDGPAQFAEFLYEHVVPACFLAPLRSSFDLTDAQTVQALQESAGCLRAVYEQRGEELVNFLQSRYMPTLELEPDVIQRFCQALRSDTKVFRNYTKMFFRQARS